MMQKNRLDVTVYADEAQAKQDLENGKISAVVVFPSSVTNDDAVRLYVDSSDSITPPLVQGAVTQVLLGLGATNPIIVDKIYGDITVSPVLWRGRYYDGHLHLHHVRRRDRAYQGPGERHP